MKKTIFALISALCVSLLCGAQHEFKGKKLIHCGWSDGSVDSLRKNIALMEKSAPVYSVMRIFISGVD